MNLAQWVAPGKLQVRKGGRRVPGVGAVVPGSSDPGAHLAHTTEAAASMTEMLPYPEIPSARTRLRTGETVEVAAYDGPGHVAIQILRTTNGRRTHAVDTDIFKVGAERGRCASDDAATAGTVAAEALTRMAHALRVQTEFDFEELCPSFALADAIVACYGEIYVVGTGMVSFLTVADAPAMEKPRWRVTFFWSHDPDNWSFLERLGLVHRKKLEGVGTKRLPIGESLGCAVS